ncbi:hypothetical protein JRO89_XS09G0218900 [Xanthoceras sorbifolium]|uniref:Protein kinase domain-containing protein n=1 Tax=Xanthoceras sorbifolium TaxID=99658 RepID=A0ABQ8HME8_9ROSI|nr:hypothetical protein JRO89_XS09G0218900 [Xanthoceras sorbifolium]
MGLQWALLVMEVCVVFIALLSVHGSSVALPPMRLSQKPPTIHPVWLGQPPSTLPEHALPPTLRHPISARRRHGKILTPPSKVFHSSSITDNSPTRAAHSHNPARPSSIAVAPSMSSFTGHTWRWVHSPASSPSMSFHKYHHAKNKYRNSAPGPSHLITAPTYSQQGSVLQFPHFNLSLHHQEAGVHMHEHHHQQSHQAAIIVWKGLPLSFFFFFLKLGVFISFTVTIDDPNVVTVFSILQVPIPQPTISPVASSLKTKNPPPSTVMTLPPPPPNEDCASVTCTEPLTYTPPGTPCGCVWPIQVKLSLSVAIYTFFPKVSELAEEIGSSIRLNHSQVRITGANAASQQLEKSTVLINLVPRGVKFDDTTAMFIYKKFWRREVFIKASLFGAYEVLYVRYPGLPPSPPSPRSDITTVDDGPYAGRDNNGQAIKPLGVDVPKRKKNGLSGSMIAVIALSSFTAFILCFGIAWLIIMKRGACVHQSEQVPHDLISSPAKPSGAPRSTRYGSVPSSTSMSFDSSAMTYTGSAKTFALNDIERATKSFDALRIIGEGGFGVVYRGTLDDGREVAVKVLKRDDQRGGREFLAEVEMLSRLHHRNLVKLIGICIEGHNRCLVYELVPNGSVDLHLHGRYEFKIILLELTSYLAPEYAMTGHLLVKSDVYSYGVVLLELLTGRKPVDLSQPPGQENLVAWARPLLTSKEGLETVIDPFIKSNISFDIIVKVAAIASMCVQPEVSHRPFMGEVVQALKLVCNEFDETKEIASRGLSEDESFIGEESKIRRLSGEPVEVAEVCHPMSAYGFTHDNNVAISASDLLNRPVGLERQESGSFRRHSSSGPLRTGRKRHFWQRLKSLSRGSMSEHGFSSKLWSGSH